MATLGAMIGATLAWVVILLIGGGAGYGALSAWNLWGSRLPLPPRVQAVAVRLLGPPAPMLAGEGVPVSAEATGGSMAHAAPRASAAVDAAATAEAAPAAPAEDAPEVAVAPEAPAEAPIRLSRSDAIEELTAIFGADYEAAKALLANGLWGLENHEEWARAMRGKTAPEGVPVQLFDTILKSSPKEYAPRLAAHRERRAALSGLLQLWGVGVEEAEALYAAGYKDAQAIRAASTEKLAKIRGVGHALAFQIRAAAHGLAPTP